MENNIVIQNTHSFTIVGGDTDSIMFCKPDQSPFTEEEQAALIAEINSFLPPLIKYENDGLFSRVIYLKAKNYIMIDSKGKRKIKGSSLKSSTLEPALKTMLAGMIEHVITGEFDKMVGVYNKTIKEVLTGIKDISQWAKKMQLSPTTFNSTRANETKVIDAIRGTNYRSGDRVYLYFKEDCTLGLAETFDGKYDRDSYLKKVHNTAQRFETVLDTKKMFPNYTLKRNAYLIDSLLKT